MILGNILSVLNRLVIALGFWHMVTGVCEVHDNVQRVTNLMTNPPLL
jgi:hypothetical protein